jgi:hypothetical protein
VSHTYASVDQFKNFLLSGGNTTYDTTDDAEMLRVLEGASRRIDGYCGRSRFGSGFGPRVASNTYDHNGGPFLDFDDDFISVTTVTSAPYTGQAGVTMTSGTDYLLDPPTVSQKRRLIFPGLGSISIGSGYQVFVVAGTAGYDSETESVGAMATATSSATTLTLTSGSAFPGATLLIESEQVYVTAATGGTALTVVRGVNGTTAATHAASTTVSRYRYDRAVEAACLSIAQRRWRMREAGVVGDYGGGAVPTVAQRDSERSLLNGTIGHLRVFTAA